jgi:hypothetical protein
VVWTCLRPAYVQNLTAAELNDAKRGEQVSYTRYFRPKDERKRSRSDATAMPKRPRTDDPAPGGTASAASTEGAVASVAPQGDGVNPKTPAAQATVAATASAVERAEPEPQVLFEDDAPLMGAATPP